MPNETQKSEHQQKEYYITNQNDQGITGTGVLRFYIFWVLLASFVFFESFSSQRKHNFLKLC